MNQFVYTDNVCVVVRVVRVVRVVCVVCVVCVVVYVVFLLHNEKYNTSYDMMYFSE